MASVKLTLPIYKRKIKEKYKKIYSNIKKFSLELEASERRKHERYLYKNQHKYFKR